MGEFNLSKLLEHVAQRMDAEVREAKFVGPSVEVGTRREEILLEFLRKYLPRRYYVGTGIVISPLGRSQQQDVVVFDDVNCQKLPQTAVGSIFPAEGVVGTIQVKSLLTKEELGRAITNLHSAKTLFREKEFRPFGLVFAFDCSNSESIKDELERTNTKYVDDYLAVDRVYIPNIAVMSYFEKKAIRLRGQSAYELRNRNYGTGNVLHFYRYLLSYLAQPREEEFDISDYFDPDYFDNARTRASQSGKDS